MDEEEDTYTEDITEFIPNYAMLSEEDKIKASEMIYRRQIIHTTGYILGDFPEDRKRKRRE